MKNCPYCAEEIKDEAIKCRWCLSWLVEEPPATAWTPPAGASETKPEADSAPSPSAEAPAAAAAPTVQMSTAAPVASAQSAAGGAAAGQDRVEFTHTGERYLLVYGPDYFGIWDRQSPNAPTERYPRTDDGWRQVWQRYVSVESNWMDLRTGQRS